MYVFCLVYGINYTKHKLYAYTYLILNVFFWLFSCLDLCPRRKKPTIFSKKSKMLNNKYLSQNSKAMKDNIWVYSSIGPWQKYTTKLPLIHCPNELGLFLFYTFLCRFIGKKVMVKVPNGLRGGLFQFQFFK